MDQADQGCCSSCHLVLKQPYVQCKTCKDQMTIICLDCFSKGRQFGKHKRTHRYVIINEHFTVLDDNWTADEEHKLLEALLQKGEGNWEEISKTVATNKSPQECQSHYQDKYLDNLDFPGFDQVQIGHRIDRPVLFAPMESPGEIQRPAQRSQMHKDLAGYNAARGDFDWESDNLAEMELNIIEANDDLYRLMTNAGGGGGDADPQLDCDPVLMASLSSTALSIHNNRLKKRLNRKLIVREYGLLNKGRDLGLPRKYPMTSGHQYSHVLKMGRILCSLDFDFLLQGLEHELEVRQTILRLQDYRNNGLKHPLAAAFYARLKAQRESDASEKSKETILDYVRSAKTRLRHLRANPLMTMTTRRSAGPLDILGLPSYEKLNEDERDLCSEARVLPQVFLDIKRILTEECEKSNGLRLADARPLVKIDVNKTRKLYDYLLKKELIWPPSPSTSSK